MEYIVFIHNNADSTATETDWAEFIEKAVKNGMFQGGSEIANQIQLGSKPVTKITDTVAGFMRFESAEKKALLDLLEEHPVLRNGGTLELCQMPKS